MEEALRKSEEFTRSIIENSPDCIKVLDLEGLLQFMNPAGLKTMKITNFAEYLNFPYLDFFQGENREAAREALDRARHGETGVFQAYYPTLEGTPKWWDVHVTPIFSSGGQVERLLSVSRDITGQKQVEEIMAQFQEHLATLVMERTAELSRANEALDEARRNWEEIFQAIGHPTLILDPEHGIIEANRATLTALGKTAAEIKGRKCYEFFHHQDQPPADCPLLKLQNSGQLETVDMEVEALEGAYLVSCTPVFDAQGNFRKVIHIATDITDRKRVEEALEQSEKRFKDIAENALEWIWEVDAQGKYVYASPVVEKLLGYQPEELLNKHFYDLFHPDDREELKEQAFAVLAAKQPFREFLNRNLHKDGREVWMSTSGLPVLDEEGELIGYRGADTDITARKRAEEVLQNERQRFFSLLEQIPAFVCLLAEDYTFSYVNREFRERFGDPGDSRCYEFLFTRQEPCEECHTFRVFSEQKAQLWEWTGPDQNTYAIHDYPFIDIDGSQLILELGVDITARKLAEDALKQSEEKYRLLVNQIPAVVFKGYADWSVDFYDQKIEDLSGYRKEDFDSRSIKWCDLIPAEDLDYAKRVLIKAYRTESKSFVREHRITRKNGGVRWVQCRGQIVCDAQGRIDYVSGVTFDITDHKEMEQHLARLNRIYRLLSRTNEAILRIRDRNALFQEACRIGVEEGGLRMAWAGLVDPETLLVRPVAQGGDDQGYLDEVVVSTLDVPEGRGPTGIAIRENRVAVVNDWERDPIIAPWREKGIKRGFFSSMSIPLEEENRIIGALTFYAGEPNFFTPEEVNLFTSLRDNISFGLTLLKQEQRRREAEEAITVSEAKYRQIVETAHEGIWSVDRDGCSIFINENMANWLGYTAEEIQGRNITEFLFAEDLADYHSRAENQHRGENQVLERRFKRIDGSELWTIVSMTAVLDDQGEYQGSFAMVTNITEHKIAQEQYKTIVQTALNGFLLVDTRGRILETNEASCKMLGYTEEELLQLTLADIEARLSPEEIAQALPKIMAAGAAIFETQHRRKDGHIIDVVIATRYLSQIGGGLFYAFMLDITARKTAEERYSTIIQTALDGFWLMDTQGRILEANQAYCKMSGYTQEELARMTVADIEAQIPPEEIAQVIQRIMATGEAAFETRHRAKDGRIIDIEVSTQYLPHGESGLFCAFIRDITERKRAEEQIHQSQMRLQAVFDGIPEPLIMVDRNLRLKLLNRAARHYYRADSLEIVLDRHCHQAFRGLAAPCAGCEVPAAVSQGEFLLCERQGARDPARLEEVFVYPLPETTGQEGAAIIRISDITEARMMERHLLQSEKLASLGLLVAGIAHEINNPNSFITFNIPILRSYLQELLPVVDGYARAHPDFAVCRMPYGEFRRDIFKLVDNLEHGSIRINSTVAALRDFARERGKGEITEFDLRTVIDRVVSICQGRVRRTAKTFTVEVPAGLPPISSDPLALEQILVNLLINAAQALDKEESRVTLKVALGETRDERFIIEVSDNGCGMDAATRRKIFDPFFTTKPAGAGTGLGLSIVHRLVEELGGRIEVVSEPGQGTTFRLFLKDKG